MCGIEKSFICVGMLWHPIIIIIIIIIIWFIAITSHNRILFKSLSGKGNVFPESNEVEEKHLKFDVNLNSLEFIRCFSIFSFFLYVQSFSSCDPEEISSCAQNFKCRTRKFNLKLRLQTFFLIIFKTNSTMAAWRRLIN